MCVIVTTQTGSRGGPQDRDYWTNVSITRGGPQDRDCWTNV